MKITGIVRRIDDLGRIVIPKEIRRTLSIREGDSMEMFIGQGGEIVLNKYSPIGEMMEFIKQYAESLAQVSGHIVMITDRDKFISVSGGYKNFIGKSLSNELKIKIGNRENILATKDGSEFIAISSEKNEKFVYQAISPIICEGDVIGSVIFTGNNEKMELGEVDQKLILIAARFLRMQME